MPLNIMVGVLSLLITLVLYTVAVWPAVRRKGFGPKHIWMLWIGFFFDVVATTMMAMQVGGVQHDLHSIIAFAAMFAMLAIAIVATVAMRSGNGERLAVTAKWAIPAWALWTGVFVWGMISRGAERMGG